MNRKMKLYVFKAIMLSTFLTLSGCGSDDGTDGADGLPGIPGDPGATGGDGLSVKVTDRHGTEMLESTGAFADAGKYYANAAVTSATAAVDGTVTVNFTVKDQNMDPVAGVTGVDFSIVKLLQASGTESFNKWVSYIYRTETVSGNSFPNPDGTTVEQGYRENNGIFTDNLDGSYSYVFATNLSTIVTPVNNTPIGYDRSLTHRVVVQMGGSSGATAEATFDFVPDGSAVVDTRNIVETAACKSCHGNEFRGHGGDRLTVEGCVTCHNPSTTDAQSGQTLDLKVMIHKIHAGGQLPSVHGADGIFWDDPGTTGDESADNGEYAIWGYRTSKHDWGKVGFPAIIENCTKCHQEIVPDLDPTTLAGVDNWKTVPSRAACESCHDDLDIAAGTNHAGGSQTDDNDCDTCHQPDTGGIAPIALNHAWTQKLPHHVPEFTVDLTVTGASGSDGEFVNGDRPVVNIVINEGGFPIDHTTVVKDTVKDCVSNPCTEARDGEFSHIYLMVHGPRAERNPALSTAARADVVGGAGPFDLSAAVDLRLKVDNGKDLYSSDNGGTIKVGSITVDVADGIFANTATATATEIVTWLNANAEFAARAIAYIDEASGNVAIRSKNLGKFFAVQLETSDVTTEVFGSDTTIKVVGGYYARNDLAIMAVSADNDPKAAWSTGSITYTLDPVDHLRPGTYIASVEIADRGRVNGSIYWTPSVAKVGFEVKQADEELAPAGNCGSCHQGPEGTGYVLDFARHYKIFDNTAIDQCGGCHDYQSQTATGSWGGAKTINKRVHAIHYGSSLNYPLLTVDYSGGDPVHGRNWDITFPQDVRNCEACHAEETTSGSWKTNAARNPCSGCHDSDAATAHLKLMTFDPTPADPWSGDEEESCQVCH